MESEREREKSMYVCMNVYIFLSIYLYIYIYVNANTILSLMKERTKTALNNKLNEKWRENKRFLEICDKIG